MSDEADGMSIYGDLPDAFALVESVQVESPRLANVGGSGLVCPVVTNGYPVRVERKPPEVVHGLQEPEPKTADHGIARLSGDYQIFTPLTELPGYDPEADLVLVSKAGKLRWVPLETCP